MRTSSMAPLKNPKGVVPYAPIRQLFESPTLPVNVFVATCVPLT
jgi:hypothetical protein